MITLIAITGGIGAGKSIVSEVLRCMGYSVYDCDSNAKRLMDTSESIKSLLISQIHPCAVSAEGCIDRGVISEVVFSDPSKLAALNSIVHGAVRDDIIRWSEALNADVAFVETAILYQSQLDKMVDEVWDVVAPEEIRISRVCRRNNLHPDQVSARIEAQKYEVKTPHNDVKVIHNDDSHSILLQIHQLLNQIKKGEF